MMATYVSMCCLAVIAFACMMIGFDTKHSDNVWLVMGIAVIINSLAIWAGTHV